ncbi:MAG: poly(3-hydroxyalkanoate) depolymerase, partial [Polaromonas sp.]
MNPSFQRLMTQATRLTQAGRLQDATAAIQAAFGAAVVPAGSQDPRVIDVEAREVKREVPQSVKPVNPAP